MQRRSLCEISHLRTIFQLQWYIPSCHFSSDTEDVPYADVPKPNQRQERKPYPTPMKVLIWRAKEEKKARRENPCQILNPPDNGLLVPELVEVAHEVNQARELVLDGLVKLIGVVVPVNRCRFCSEVHVGHSGHEIRTCTGPKSGLRSATHVWRKGGIDDVMYFPHCYHLYDRVGKPRIGHKERFQVRRLPAILELCIQAGLDLEDYPAKRRTRPIYAIDGRIIDFEIEKEEADNDKELCNESDGKTRIGSESGLSSTELSERTLESWLQMREGTRMLMKRYYVNTCGYCPEVQVGSKGHKVRACKAARHQFRKGLHAWQEATLDDLIGPNYVWHVRDPQGPPLANELKRYYGKAPAVVELCVQAGAPVPKEYKSMMRLDVVPPHRDEIDLVT
ncbi:APO protein 3, mitochondrial [Aristolochia californica]|uniref:APO protein 3, mitochondrial n=1 Tax=Aristolochia californica TaxID=171875 RepID=UPI0035DBC337